MSAQKVMQRGRARFLRAGKNEVESLNLRRLLRNISEMYIAKPVGKLTASPANLASNEARSCGLCTCLYDSRMYKWFYLQFRCSVFLFIVGMTTCALADEGMCCSTRRR